MSEPGVDQPIPIIAGLSVAGSPSLELVGAKALGLLRMVEAGLPVPEGFALGTPLCREWLEHQRRPPQTEALLSAGVRLLEQHSGLGFGGRRQPLLLSVRSGAAASQPGMLETLLDVGINDTSVRGLIRHTGNPRLAWDSYRRLIQGFAEVVAGCSPAPFQRLLTRAVEQAGVANERELDATALETLSGEMLDLYRALCGEPFPQEPMQQLLRSVEAVWRSWSSPRAVRYRKLHRLDDLAGTAVTVQRMVFGNAGGFSGSGVGFTRDPASGEDRLYLDFLRNAQGEDVVSGRYPVAGGDELEQLLPGVYSQLEQLRRPLERVFGDMQDFEFTVEQGRLYLLQSRADKCSAWAALHAAVQMVEQGLLAPPQALERLAEYNLAELIRRRLRPAADQQPLARAVPASVGVAAGQVALSPERAQALAEAGEPSILVRQATSTDDIAGIAAASGLLTAVGGRTSHAAVVARQLDKVCLVGCRELAFENGGCCRIAGTELHEGDPITLDGDSGHVYAGHVEVVEERPEALLAEVQRWRLSYGP